MKLVILKTFSVLVYNTMMKGPEHAEFIQVSRLYSGYRTISFNFFNRTKETIILHTIYAASDSV